MKGLLYHCAEIGTFGPAYQEQVLKEERLAEEYSQLKTPIEIAEFIKRHQDFFKTKEQFETFLKEVKKNEN